MKKFFVLLATILLLGVVCGRDEIKWPIERVTFKLLKQDNINQMQNQLYSPIALGNAIGVMINGANDQLRDEIMKVMFLNKTDQITMMNNEFEMIMNTLKNRQEMFRNKVGIAFKNGLQIKPDFQEKISKNYPIVIQQGEINKPEFITQSNAKINEKTGGRIKNIYLNNDVKIADDTTMLMMSLAFTGKFIPEGIKSVKLPGKSKMRTIDNKEVDKEIIRINGEIFTLIDDEKIMFQLPIKGNLSLAGLMPKIDFGKYIKEKFDCDKLKVEVMQMYQQKKELVDMKMPLIDIEKEYRILDLLHILGVKKDNLIKPNVWPMIGNDLKLGNESIHRTKLVVETGNDQIPETIPGAKVIDINRPFIFVIKDHTTEMILMGGMMMM